MTSKQVDTYRDRLLAMSARIRGDMASLEDEVRESTGGEAGGNLSNAPMHLADLGSAEYMQELDATLYENEEYLGAEVAAALDRIERGTFGRCERCGKAIPRQRLDALPYTRFCVPCAEVEQAGEPVNLDAGRPQAGLDPSDARRAQEDVPEGVIPGDDVSAFAAEQSNTTASAHQDDVHAAGTPGGGTAVGGLAGTNTGSGDPANADLEAAMGSGTFDQEIEAGRGDTSSERPRTGRPKAKATRGRK